MNLIKRLLVSIVKTLPIVFVSLVLGTIFVFVVIFSYYTGVVKGYQQASSEAEDQLADIVSSVHYDNANVPSPTPRTVIIDNRTTTQSLPSWGGPELWEAVNARRKELGVNPLENKAEICTVASIRLNQLLELGKLDAHEGFSKLPEERDDIRWIYEKYDLTEFLVSGAASPEDAVSLWENTLGHKKLLTGGEYVWGCIYAQSGFGVAITAY